MIDNMSWTLKYALYLHAELVKFHIAIMEHYDKKCQN